MTQPDAALMEALRRCRFAEDLSPDQVAVLASIVTLVTVRPGEVVARGGAVDERAYAVVDGRLDVVLRLDAPDEAPIVTLGAGDLAHELGFLDGTPRYANLVAATETTLLVFDRAGLEGLLDTHPRVVYGVLRAILRTVHRTQTRLAIEGSELSNYVYKQHGRY